MLGAFSAGSAAGGLAYGARTWHSEPGSRLLACVSALAALLILPAASPDVPLLALALIAAGIPLAGSLTTGYLIASDDVPAVRRTEAFAWLSLTLNTGVALGNVAAGTIATDGTASHGFILASACATAGAGALAVAAIARSRAGAQPGGLAPRTTRLLVRPRVRAQALGMNQTSFLGDKPVNRIGFGAMQLAGPGVFGPPREPDAARAVLRRAIELGVDHIDTAQYYGPDVVNDLIRESLHPYPENLKLATKVGGRRDDQGAWLPAQSPAELRAGVEDNLRSLGVERMDLVNLRLMDAEAAGDQLAEQLGTLEDMRGEGKLDLIGISEAGADAVHRALELVDIAEVQNAYSVVNRSAEDVLELCRERDIAFVPYFPLGSAFTGGPRQLAQDPAVAGVAARRGITATQVALAWLLARYERMLLIPGTSSVEHLEENLAAADVDLDEQDLDELQSVASAARVA